MNTTTLTPFENPVRQSDGRAVRRIKTVLRSPERLAGLLSNMRAFHSLQREAYWCEETLPQRAAALRSRAETLVKI